MAAPQNSATPATPAPLAPLKATCGHNTCQELLDQKALPKFRIALVLNHYDRRKNKHNGDVCGLGRCADGQYRLLEGEVEGDECWDAAVKRFLRKELDINVDHRFGQYFRGQDGKIRIVLHTDGVPVFVARLPPGFERDRVKDHMAAIKSDYDDFEYFFVENGIPLGRKTTDINSGPLVADGVYPRLRDEIKEVLTH